MPTVRGSAAVRSFLSGLPGELETKVLRGAARAAGKVVMAEAQERSVSSGVAAAIVMRSKAEPGRIVVTITVRKGWERSVANWLEWGTAPHFITVDDSQRGGMSVRRINKIAKDSGDHHSLIIGGKFVGDTVFHPGASRHPFLRPALDIKSAEAIAAAQTFITTKITKAGIVGQAEGDAE